MIVLLSRVADSVPSRHCKSTDQLVANYNVWVLSVAVDDDTFDNSLLNSGWLDTERSMHGVIIWFQWYAISKLIVLNLSNYRVSINKSSGTSTWEKAGCFGQEILFINRQIRYEPFYGIELIQYEPFCGIELLVNLMSRRKARMSNWWPSRGC